ncbi:DegT/DnrJ/EryC1/StrS family aminotransferase, partial [Candidatus Peregrinibacteria bacterium]|nr:DegT/DnrJ/EryC1/StrS family aminotransferase [Candidatus Peregrinibacteria bacterium]
RDQFFLQMRSKDIGVHVHHIPVYHHSYYARFSFNPADFPITEDYFQRAITLPLYPAMTDQDVERVIRETIATIETLKKL